MINNFEPSDKDEKLLPASFTEPPVEIVTAKPEVFETPEQVAAKQATETLDKLSVELPVASATQKKFKIPGKPRIDWHKFKLSWPPHKKEYIAVVIFLILIGGGAGAWILTHPATKKVVAVKTAPVVVKKVVAPVKVPSTLTGLPVDASINQGPVTGVMIENSLDARPQSGLSQAGVVFEAIAEGGITRFLALYQDTAPANVGPIRSARPYYLQWALGFDAGYAHVGGSPEAMADINTWGVRNLDQFYNSGYYHRVDTRAAPHNVYTAIATLNQLEISKGYTSSSYTGFSRKIETPAKIPTAKTINLHISGALYDVSYAYDATTNSYLRSEGGVPHADAETGTQLSPKVVIALVMPYSLEADGSHSVYNTIGSGPVYIFEDGVVSTGQWTKSSNASQFVFTDSNNVVINLNPGQTWLTAMANTADVAYAP